MNERSPALDRLVLSLCTAPVPRVCFLPTASGDQREQATRFVERFGEWPCVPSVLSLFHLGRDRIDPVTHLRAQDAIYVGGGSMRNMLAIWREHGIDLAMREAWVRGAVLAGLSAGAMCWFEGGVSLSGGAPEVVPGLGLLPGSLSVHLRGEPERLPSYRTALAAGALPPGYAVDDGAALLYAGTRVLEAVASRPDARLLSLCPDGRGGVRERRVPLRLLASAAPARQSIRDEHGVAELRALRAGRRRWE
jgi:dipeptidase E